MLQGQRAGHYRYERRVAELGGYRQVTMLASTPSDRNYIWMLRATLLRADREVEELLAHRRSITAAPAAPRR